MKCIETQEMFSDYLDGTVNGREMQAVAAHLEGCGDCQGEFDAWRDVQQALAIAGPVRVPADLNLQLRLAISHENSKRNGRLWNSLSTRWDNLLRPALLQVSAGLVGAIALIGGIAMLIGVVAAPQPVMANDEPLGALTAPHYLYSAARLQPVQTDEDTTIVIQADVNASGQVYNYKILSGPTDGATDAQVRDQLMLQIYEPARAYGEPVRGQVLITFAGVSVRG